MERMQNMKKIIKARVCTKAIGHMARQMRQEAFKSKKNIGIKKEGSPKIKRNRAKGPPKRLDCIKMEQLLSYACIDSLDNKTQMDVMQGMKHFTKALSSISGSMYMATDMTCINQHEAFKSHIPIGAARHSGPKIKCDITWAHKQVTEHQSFQIVLGWLWERYNTVCNLCKYKDKHIPTWVEEALAECTACKEGNVCTWLKNQYAQSKPAVAPDAFPSDLPTCVSPWKLLRLFRSKLLELAQDESRTAFCLAYMIVRSCDTIPSFDKDVHWTAPMTCAFLMILAHWLEPCYLFDQKTIHMLLDQQLCPTTEVSVVVQVAKFLLQAFKSIYPSKRIREAFIQWLYENIIRNSQAIIEDKQFGQNLMERADKAISFHSRIDSWKGLASCLTSPQLQATYLAETKQAEDRLCRCKSLKRRKITEYGHNGADVLILAKGWESHMKLYGLPTCPIEGLMKKAEAIEQNTKSRIMTTIHHIKQGLPGILH